MKFTFALGIFFILAILAIGCVTEFTAKLSANEEQILIVDGNIIEDTVVTFYIGKSISLNSVGNAKGNLITNAKLTIIGDNGYQSSPATYSDNSMYSINAGTLDDNVSYGIQIEYDGNTYRSALSKPLHTPEIDSISWIQPEKDSLSWIQPEKYDAISFRVSMHDTDSQKVKFYMWDYKEDWETTAYYYTEWFFDPITSEYYNVIPNPRRYCWKKNRSNQYILGSTEQLKENRIINKEIYQCELNDDRFTNLYCITVNQKAISKGAYNYYQNKILLNENMGGLFTPQPSEVIGNIACITDPSKKVMGYIETLKNVTQKRIFIYPHELTRPWIPTQCYFLTYEEANAYRCGIQYYRCLTWSEFYAYTSLRPFWTGTAPDENKFPWAPVQCTDCVAAGGSKNKPDFWPNDHQ